MGEYDHSTQIQRMLDQLRAGDASVRDQLIERAFDRLRRQARRMFHKYPALRSAVETDDVLQSALIKLNRALPHVQPETVKDFFGIAGEQVRRKLIDLARKYLGAGGAKAEQVVFLGGSRSKSHHRLLENKEAPDAEPATLAEWAEFHEQVGQLPDEEREAFDLIFYQGLTHPEAARIADVSLRTMKRRWRNAQILLHRLLQGDWPAI